MKPNPVSDLLEVELFDDLLNYENINVLVVNAQGQLMTEINYNELPYGSKFLVNTDEFNSGYYMLIIQKDAIRIVRPFIKMRN